MTRFSGYSRQNKDLRARRAETSPCPVSKPHRLPRRDPAMKIRVGEVNTKFVAFLAIVAAFATVLTIGVGTAQAAVGGPTCNVPTDYPTIQAAVNDPGCSTINVAAGTYTENVVINRTLTLNGAQAGFGACGRVASESIVTPLNPLVRTLELQGSLGVTIVINGFTFLGGTRAIRSEERRVGKEWRSGWAVEQGREN